MMPTIGYAELDARLAHWRRTCRRAAIHPLLSAAGVVGIAAGAPRLWPGGDPRLAGAALLAWLSGSALLWSRIRRNAIASCRLECPGCAAPLVGADAGASLRRSGCCPECGLRVVRDDGGRDRAAAA